MRRDAPLSIHQVQVLEWIGDGCPDGIWRDFTYKTTAIALASRGLIVVDRRRKQWSAALTDAGRLYLKNGQRPNDSARAGEPASDTGSDAEQFAAELLRQLLTETGQVVVEAPSDRQRARYRRAIHHLITHRQIPDGFALRHSGRDRGDLTIHLIGEADAPNTEPAPKIQVPEAGAKVSPEIHDLVTRMRMAVTEPTMPRAQQILQAVANENAKRGWKMELDPHDDRRFQITTQECSFDLALREELVDAELPDTETLTAAKYPWQRVPLKASKVGSGRLTLQLGQYYRARTWSDRTRWRLDDKLGTLFVELDHRVAQATEERREREADLLRRQQAWDEAVNDAQQAYVLDLNRRRLTDQVTRRRQAHDMRQYAERLEECVGSANDAATAASIRGWQRFARAEADRIDPLGHVDQLVYLDPATVGPDEFAAFLPNGLNAHHRPTR